MSDKEGSVQIRTSQKQGQIVEQLSRTPIVEIACQKIGIGRNSYYRWRRQSKKFASACDKAIEEGCAFINDLAESKLISAMKDDNLTAVMYWLNHRHNTYKNKLEVTTKISDGKLSPEQEADINKAEKLLMPNRDSGEKRGKNAKKEINRECL